MRSEHRNVIRITLIRPQLLDNLEPIIAQGGNVVEHHESDMFPVRWFSLIVVLRTDNTVLYDRLYARFAPPGRQCAF